MVQYQILHVLHRSCKQIEGHSNKNSLLSSENNVKCLDEKNPRGRETEGAVFTVYPKRFLLDEFMNCMN